MKGNSGGTDDGKITVNSSNDKIACKVGDISSLGMLCRSPRQIKELTLLELSFQLPGIQSYNPLSPWIRCGGVVVHCEKKRADKHNLPYEVAIFFNRISEKNRSLLLDYTESEE